MNKKDKTALTPKYRFSEFKIAEAWKMTPLNSLAIKVTNKNKDGIVTRVLTNSAVDGVVDQSDYFEREIVTHSNVSNYFIVNEGDFVYNPRISSSAPVGPISKNKIGTGIMSPLYTVFRFNNPQNDFYEQYFKTNLWNDYLKTVANTGARYDRISISADDFMAMPLPFSSEEEQQKIADCLSSLDDLIAAEDKKLSALKDHKKGLMQKLFPTEDKTLPELRFPEFRDCDDWKEKILENVCISISSGKSKKAVSNEKFPLMGSTGQIGFCDTADYDDELILIARVGANAGQVNFFNGKCGISDNTLIVIAKKEIISIKFLLMFLINYKISKIIFGSGQPLVTGGQIKNIKIFIPTKAEQQKIADCLSFVDELISAQAEKIEALKAHKKGLMQGLFPSIEEVSQ
ncbi:MAG: restriction endonuclease subunit S [Anaerovorax sp.]|nr:restriction endonuclease subunit S [Anaerovorax sp.]